MLKVVEYVWQLYSMFKVVEYVWQLYNMFKVVEYECSPHMYQDV